MDSVSSLRTPRRHLVTRMAGLAMWGAVLAGALGVVETLGPTTSALAAPVHAVSARAAVKPVVVVLHRLMFTPTTVHIRVGQSVEWKWNDNPVPHNVTFKTFHSKLQSTGTFVHRFTKAGVYHYDCTIHVQAGMVGTVIVKA